MQRQLSFRIELGRLDLELAPQDFASGIWLPQEPLTHLNLMLGLELTLRRQAIITVTIRAALYHQFVEVYPYAWRIRRCFDPPQALLWRLGLVQLPL